MSELSDIEAQISQLSKRLEEQTRLTRSLIALCTTLLVGVMFFIFTLTIEHLPQLIIVQYMSKLDSIVQEWKQIEHGMKPRN